MSNRFIVASALRLARLAAMDRTPAVILFDMAEVLCRRCGALYENAGGDPEQYRRDRLVVDSEALAPLTPEEEAELEQEQRAFDEADEKARIAAGYSETEWDRLDTSYRFDLVMQHMPEGSA